MPVTARSRTTSQRGSRRRGASYIFFLGTALLVTIIGLSALAVMRVRLRAAAVENDTAAARFYARSAVDSALLTIAGDDDWRSHIAHGAWDTERPIGDGSLTFKIIDEVNGNLTTDPNAPVRVFGKGMAGEAIWIYSVKVQPPPAGLYPDLITNGGIETGAATPWVATIGCDVSASGDASVVRSGLWGLEIKNRLSADAGVGQTLAAAIEEGATYYGELWVKMRDVPDIIWFRLRIETMFDTFLFRFDQAQVGTEWTRLSGTITPSWSSTATHVVLDVGTELTNKDFLIDDVSMRLLPTEIGPLAGTWQREAD